MILTEREICFSLIIQGKCGRGENELSMPVKVIVDDSTEQEQVYVLDPGNSRIKCLSLEGKFINHLGKLTLISYEHILDLFIFYSSN